jgi:hypothetical protein
MSPQAQVQDKGLAELYIFGGVDSRSNPLNMPQDRSLLCSNWVPNIGGWLELRRGYTELATTGATIGAYIHSIAPYTMWTNVKYLLLGAGANVYSLALATGVITEIGTLNTSNPWNWFPSAGQINIGDGANVWFFDGTTLRLSGIRSMTTAEANNVSVSIGTDTPSLSGTTVVFASGGDWLSNDVTGEIVYGAVWDPLAGAISPLVAINTTPILGVAGQRLNASSLPLLSGSKLWVLACTADGGTAPSYISARGTSSPTALPFTSFSVSGQVVTVVSTGHGMTDGYPIAVIYQTGTQVAWYGGVFRVDPVFANVGPVAIAVIDANHYSFQVPAGTTVPGYSSTLITYAIMTGGTIVSNLPVLAANYQQTGLPPSTVGGAQPGYQLYACIWDPVTQHAGNRMAIGARLAPSDPSTINVASLPNLNSENPEWQILLGYTIDGGEVPYLLLDSGGNWLSVPSGVTSWVIGGNYTQDQTSEMPYRNGIPPAMNKFCIIGDQALGCTGQDAYVYVSASAASPLNPEVVGQPNESWSPDDVVTFPTREVPTCIQEYNQSAMVFSLNYSAPLVNTSGVWDWGQGFPCGCAGQRAFVKTIHGPFWVTGQKQLATINTNWGAGYALATGPIVVSSEYERALLAMIGDQYLGEVEVAAYIDVAKQKDEIIIKALDVNGVPFEIVHDFNLKDDKAQFGQAYFRQYGSILAEDYTLANGFDVNGLQRVYAGGSDGNVYQEESGYNDNGDEFEATYLGLVNLGGEKPSLTDIQIWGDHTIIDTPVLQLNNTLDATGDWVPLLPAQDRGDGTHDFKFHNRVKSGESNFFYVQIQLTSHSVDAPTTELSTPPHFPVEDYGKIYLARILFGTSRGT